MTASEKTEYGTKEWFEKMFVPASEGVDLWGHQWRAGQKYRYVLTLNMIKPQLTKAGSQRLLDIGCGLGDFTHMAYKVNLANRFFGMDISQNAVSGATTKYPQIAFRCGALPQIAYTKSFDGIISLDCLCYLNEQDRRLSIENIRKHLKSNGWFLFSSPTDDDTRYFSTQQALKLLRQGGFNISQISYNYARIHSWFERPFLRLIKLSSIIQEFEKGYNKFDLTGSRRRLYRLLTYPTFGVPIKKADQVSVNVSRRILESLMVVKFFQWISRTFLKDRGISHIIVLAIKDE